MASTPPEIWVVGVEGVGRKTLIQRIISADCKETREGPYPWTIETRYYVANTTIHSYSPAFLDLEEGTTPLCEALVLVFDMSDATSFEIVKDWCGRLDLEGVEIKLAIANKVDLHFTKQQLQRPAWIDQAMEWCAENCIEYIETSAFNKVLDGMLQLDGDQVGVPRVIEALQAHMWPGHELVARGDGSKATTADQVREQGVVSDDASRLEDPRNPAAADNPSDAGVHKAVMIPQTDFVEQTTEDKDNLDSNSSVAGFEHLLLELQGARSKFSQLPDEERRQAAGDLAMRLLACMGDSGDDGSDEDA